jgi:Xaa-Pro aminopeptidase
MLHRGTSLAATLWVLLAAPAISGAQDPRASTAAARHAARRERAYARLGNDLLVVRSRWATAQFTQPAFEQDPTFYYFTGADHVLGAILVLDGKTRRAELFLPNALPPYLGPLGRTQPKPGVARADSLHVDGVADWSALSRYIERRLRDDPRPTIRVDEDVAQAGLAGLVDVALDSTAAAPGRRRSAWADALRRRWPNDSVVSSAAISGELRAVKDSAEIAALRRAATNSAAALRAGMLRFAPGRHQRDVEGAVVDACTRNAGDGPSFWPWAMSGPNAVFPTPFTSSVDMHNLNRVMRRGEVARLDIGCQVDHYMGDVGRTVPVSGSFTPDQAEVIDLLVATYRAGLVVLRDGVADSTVVQASIAEARRLRPTMRTALGRHAAAVISERDSIPYWQIHGIGLDIAESLPTVLRAGMVLDYEPIFVVDGQGFYMEDMILITPTGYEILTKGLPYSAVEIERAMRPRAVSRP